MDEETIDEAKPKNKILLILVLLLVVGLLVSGWLIYHKTINKTNPKAVTKKHSQPNKTTSNINEPHNGIQSNPIWQGLKEVSVDQITLLETELGERRIQARLLNHGRQDLYDARVDIQFLSSNGEVLMTRIINPLVISGGIFGDQSEPLASGASRSFQALADDTPPSWNGEINAQVTGFRFGKLVVEAPNNE